MPSQPRTELSLIVVEYPDGRVAVQAVQGNAEAARLFDDCQKADAEVRMSLITIELQDLDIKVTGRAKKVGKTTAGPSHFRSMGEEK